MARALGNDDPPEQPQEETKAWEVYGDLVDAELERQDSIKESLEKRGNLVITTAGGFTTFLFGITAVVTGAQSFVPKEATRILIVTAMGLFVVAALLGLLANWTMSYKVVLPEELERVTAEKYWLGATWVAKRVVAQTRIEHIERAIEKNNLKANFLTWAFFLEVLAILVLAVALGHEVWPS